MAPVGQLFVFSIILEQTEIITSMQQDRLLMNLSKISKETLQAQIGREYYMEMSNF